MEVFLGLHPGDFWSGFPLKNSTGRLPNSGIGSTLFLGCGNEDNGGLWMWGRHVSISAIQDSVSSVIQRIGRIMKPAWRQTGIMWVMSGSTQSITAMRVSVPVDRQTHPGAKKGTPTEFSNRTTLISLPIIIKDWDTLPGKLFTPEFDRQKFLVHQCCQHWNKLTFCSD